MRKPRETPDGDRTGRITTFITQGETIALFKIVEEYTDYKSKV